MSVIDSKRARARNRRRIATIAGSVLGLVVIVTALITALIGTAPGSRTLWGIATALVPGLQGKYISGTWLTGVTLQDIKYGDAQHLIELDKLAVRWEAGLRPTFLRVHSLRAGNLRVVSRSTDSGPSPAPQKIVLPLKLELNDCTIYEIAVGQADSIIRIDDVHFTAHSDGIHHQVVIDRATTQWGTLHTRLEVDGSGPVAIAADAQMNLRLREEAIAVNAHAAGPVERIAVELDATGARSSARASITATPFTRLPFTRARVEAAHFDPHAYSAGLPAADLMLEANLVPFASVGGALNVAGPISLRNAKPGRSIAVSFQSRGWRHE